MKCTILKDSTFEAQKIPFYGNKFLMGNGYFGVRGTMDEYKKENMPCVNLAGIYDKVGDKWRESVNAPNPLFTYVKVDGEVFTLPEKEPFSHEQCVNIETAIHQRKTIWETGKGKITVACERFASMANQHLICMKYTVSADYDCHIEIITAVDGDVWDINGTHFTGLTAETDKVTGVTGEKGITVVTEQFVNADFDCENEKYTDEFSAYQSMKVSSKAGAEYTFTKIASVTTSCDDFENADNICELVYETEKEKHISAWADIWDKSYVEIDGDDEAEFALNYSLYHLNCIAPRNMKNKSIAARGLSGQVYKGAVFWDTEMFMIDYYIHTEPEIAKTLIGYRIDTLDGARNKAREYNLDGVIVSTDDCHYEAWKKMADEEGIYFDKEINNRLRGVSRSESLEIILERAEKEYTEEEKVALATRKNGYYTEFIKKLTPADILPGAKETLDELKANGIKVAIGSSSKNTPIILKQIGLDTYFDAVSDGNNISKSKPDPEVFIKAADMLGIPYDECMIVEDADAGVEAGKRAGMKTLSVHGAKGADISVEDLSEESLISFI